MFKINIFVQNVPMTKMIDNKIIISSHVFLLLAPGGWASLRAKIFEVVPVSISQGPSSDKHYYADPLLTE